MAKDMLDAVYEAEEQCAKREADAKTAAAKKVEAAKQDALQAQNNSKQKALLGAEALYAKTRAEGENLLREALAEADLRCSELSKTAQKNRVRVTELAVKQLID